MFERIKEYIIKFFIEHRRLGFFILLFAVIVALLLIVSSVRADENVQVYMGTGVNASSGSTLVGGSYRFRHKSSLDSWRVGMEGWSDISNPPVTTTTTTQTVTPGFVPLHHGTPPPPPPVPFDVTTTTTSTCDDANYGGYAGWAPQWKFFSFTLGTFYAAKDNTCNVDQRWLGYANAFLIVPVNKTVSILLGGTHKSDFFGDAADENHLGGGAQVRF